MLEFALEKLSTKNYPKVGLWVLSSNENAIHFYKKLGFSDTGIVKEENLGEIITESFLQRKSKKAYPGICFYFNDRQEKTP
ncbi:GNAT family N-acetyltransferase [Lactococcus lactis]